MPASISRLKPVALIWLGLLLWACPLPARAELAPESIYLSLNGDTHVLTFDQGQSTWTTHYQSSRPVEVVLTVEVAEGLGLRIDNISYPGGAARVSDLVSYLRVFTVQIYRGAELRTYIISVYVDPPSDEADSGSSGPGSVDTDPGYLDPATDPLRPDAGDAGETTAPGGQDLPPQQGDAYEDSPAAPEPNRRLTHLILYINAPFLIADDLYIPADTSPYLVTDVSGGYTMVPVRFIAEALGARVTWEPGQQRVGIMLDGRQFELTIGKLVPGTPVAAVIRDSRTFVPLRYVMESFGAQVGWSQAERRIDVWYVPAL